MAQKEILFNEIRYKISYEILNLNAENSIVFLHGWGSNKEIMKASFAKHIPKDYKQIYIDLPGFGNSTILKPLQTKEYAKIIKKFLESLHVKPSLIIGHSFGGKIATLLNHNNLVLLSSAGIPKEKSLKTKIKIKLFKIIKPIGGKKLYKFFATKDVKDMSQIMYETLKNVVDEDFREIFKSYNGKALIYWGKKDKATPLKSGEEIAKLIKNSKFKIYDGDHFFFTKYAKDITDDIIGELNNG